MASVTAPGERRRAYWLTLLAVAAVAALCGALYLREMAGIEGRLRERETARVEVLTQLLRSELEPAIDVLLILADGHGLQSFLQTGASAELQLAARRAQRISRQHDEFAALAFIDASGRELLRVERGGELAADGPLDHAPQDWFRRAAALEAGKVLVSALGPGAVREPGSSVPHMSLDLATPVFDRLGQRRGVYLIRYPVDALFARLQAASSVHAPRLRLLNARGDWLMPEMPEPAEPALRSRMIDTDRGQTRHEGGWLSWQQLSMTEFSRARPNPIVAEDAFLIIASHVPAVEIERLSAGLRWILLLLGPGLLMLTLGWVWFHLARQRLLASLRATAENLAVTLHSIGDAVLVTDERGRITRMNPVAERLTGWSQAEALGRAVGEVFQIVNEDTRQPARVPVDDVLATGEVQGLANHTLLISRDGTERGIDDSAAPMRDPGGSIRGVVLVFRDVSVERAAQRALRASEARYRTLFESIDEGFCVIEVIFDAEGQPQDYRFLEISPSFEKQSGLVNALGKRMRELTPSHEPYWFEIFGRVVTTGESIRFENRAEQQNRWFDVFAFRFGLPGQRQVGILFTDISERRRLQGELDRFFQLSIDFLCISSPDGYFKRASPAVTDILGWTVEEFLARPYMELVHPDDQAATRREVERQMQHGAKVLHFENRYLHKDGSWRVLAWRSVPDAGLMYATARDVTERKQLEWSLRQANEALERRVGQRTIELQRSNAALRAFAASLERSNRELEEFAFVASHDLQEPLRKIQAFCGRLVSRCGDTLDSTAREYLDRVLAAAERMRRMIGDVLMFSRISSSPRPLERVDLARVVAEVIPEVEQQAQQGASIDVDAASLPTIDGDLTQMRQLFQNLIGNALKFRRPHMPVRVQVSAVQRDGEVHVSISDDGIGFDEKHAERIFQIFQRLHGRAAYEGNGIGLAVCRKIVDRHGGQIMARSTPGVGSTFTVILPLRQPPAGEPAGG